VKCVANSTGEPEARPRIRVTPKHSRREGLRRPRGAPPLGGRRRGRATRWDAVPVGLSVYFPSIYARAPVSVGGSSRTPRTVRTNATTRCVTQRRAGGRMGGTHGSRGGLLVAGLASDLEGDAIGGGVLELKGGGGQVVEVLVEKLQSRRGVLASANRPRSRPLPSRNAELRSSLGPWSSATRKQSEGQQDSRATYVVRRLGDVGEGGDRHDGRLWREKHGSSRVNVRVRGEGEWGWVGSGGLAEVEAFGGERARENVLGDGSRLACRRSNSNVQGSNCWGGLPPTAGTTAGAGWLPGANVRCAVLRQPTPKPRAPVVRLRLMSGRRTLRGHSSVLPTVMPRLMPEAEALRKHQTPDPPSAAAPARVHVGHC